MPLNEADLPEIRRRVFAMLMDTVRTFERIQASSDPLFGAESARMRAMIDECLNDFVRDPKAAGESHPEAVIYAAPARDFQRAGFYGSQLDVKESQVTAANRGLRDALGGVKIFGWRRAFFKWIDVINNFMGSLVAGIGIGEALKEVKDCLRDQIEDDA